MIFGAVHPVGWGRGKVSREALLDLASVGGKSEVGFGSTELEAEGGRVFFPSGMEVGVLFGRELLLGEVDHSRDGDDDVLRGERVREGGGRGQAEEEEDGEEKEEDEKEGTPWEREGGHERWGCI